ncbi:MAG: acetate uptake transporter [Thermoplasmata archaeon]|jgi:succinate-acetate transporter protein|nr:acetate uptake transporter [Thermoplasmata archaeon]
MKLNASYLGLAAFALTTFVLSMANIGVIKSDVVIPLAFFYGGMAQFAAGMFSFKADDNFGGTAFSSYGAFWLSFGLMKLLEKFGDYKPSSTEIGVMLIAWGIFTLYMWIPSLKIGKVLSLVFLTLWLTFFILGASAIYGYSTKLGGYVGMICALLAWYVSFAGITSEIYQKKLPL